MGLQHHACTAPRGAPLAYVTKAAEKKPNARYDLYLDPEAPNKPPSHATIYLILDSAITIT